jgi:hypothetical protein
MRRSSLFAARVAMLLMFGVSTAMADCREDHAAADQNVRRTRAAIEKLPDDGSDAAKCAAYRRYIGALTAQRSVIGRCDTGANRAQNVSAIDTAIADYNKRVEGVCKK